MIIKDNQACHIVNYMYVNVFFRNNTMITEGRTIISKR